MMYKESTLYVFSGTGNTKKIAHTVSDVLESDSVKTTMVNLKDGVKGAVFRQDDALVFFMFPSHGFMPPWSVIKFLLRYPRVKDSSAVCVSTRGALKAGPVTIPGVAGFATFMAALILIFKGFKIRGLFSIDMPSNFINFHWGLNQKNVSAISKKGEARTRNYVQNVLGGKTVFLTRNNLWEIFWSLVLLYLVPVFPFIYLLIGRLSMGKIMFAATSCNHCGLCAQNCPSQAIIMTGQKKKQIPYWTHSCDVCLRCLGSCPKKAIEASQLWFILLIFVTMIPFSFYLMSLFFGPVSNYDEFLKFLNYLIIYPVILITYRIFFNFLKIKWVRRLFTYLSLTHYYRRFFHPDIKVKELR